MINMADEFINYLQVERNCSKKTLIDYRSDIAQYQEAMNILEVNQITKSNIRLFLGLLVEKEMKPATRNRKLTAIRSFCKYLCMEGYLTANPAIDISYAKVEKRLPKVFSIQQIGNVIDSSTSKSYNSKRDKAILETFYGTGVRIEELVNMKISHIDFNQEQIVVFGKGSKERLLPMSKQSIIAIKDYLISREIQSDFLFPSPQTLNAPISKRAVYNIVIKYAQANGLKMSPHKFRHSIATHLHMNGMDIRQIQEFLGHENINTTTIYTQVAIEQMSNQFHQAHPRG